MHIKLTQESIDFAVHEGEEIFRNSRSLARGDTILTKIDNCLIGAFGQQVFMQATNGHRVTREECPEFAYDVLTTNESVRVYCGWSDPREASAPARVEVKIRPAAGPWKWISFNDQKFKHATRCAESGMLDYVVFYGIQNVDLDLYEADISLLGIISATVLNQPDLRRRSMYTEGDSFLNKGRIHERNLGRIIL